MSHIQAHEAGADLPLHEQPKIHARRWWILAVLCLSLLIVFIGNSSLNVAIPTLSRDLNATNSQLQWVIAVYSLVFAGLLFSSGATGDRYGRKGALQFGLVVYLIACVGASEASSMSQLIAARAAMGVGAAFIMPSTLSILVNVFSPEERTKAIAIWASVTGAAGAIGPVASGWLLGHFWYGAVFLVNVPILVFALVAGGTLIPRSKDPQQARLDPVGAVLSIIGVVAIVYGLIEAPEHGWTSPTTLISFAVGVVVLTVFVFWELHNDEPMLDIRYFKVPAFSTGTSGMILVFMAMYGVMFLVTQYFQLILGYSALSSAVRFLPMAPIMIIVAPMTPRLSKRFGAHRTVAFGMLMVAVGLLMFRALSVDTSYWYLLVALIPLISGMALAMSPMTAAIMSAVPPRRAGAGSAMNDATRELGAALGIAIMGSVASSQYTHHVDKLTASLSPQIQDAARTSLADALGAAAELGGEAGRTLAVGTEHAFIDGIHFAVTVGSILAVIAAFAVYRFLPRDLADEASLHGPVESMEDAAELGIAGVLPVFPDAVDDETADADQAAHDAGAGASQIGGLGQQPSPA
ncbi:MAG TPA: MFS transporter [Acidimicrobiales bacterium]|nr:MFS transporter [Acidimicrobiales bacterium]